MASMAAASRLTIRGIESVPLCPCPSPIRAPALAVSRRPIHLAINFPARRNTRVLTIRAMSSDSSGSQLEESVKNTVRQNPVVVYSKSWCSYSSEVKYLFKKLGVEPHVIELDELGSQGAQIQKTLEALTGQHTVPNVFIGGKHVGGCSDTVELYNNGELEPLLSEAGAKK